MRFALLIAGSSFLQASSVFATSFTGTEFLTWPRASQDAFLQNSITMTGIVATQSHGNIADCIDRWYSADRSAHAAIHESIVETIRKNQDYHPQAVLLAVIQRRCGSFKADP